jgi:hypoxanthine phosphoribosyltransferase
VSDLRGPDPQGLPPQPYDRHWWWRLRSSAHPPVRHPARVLHIHILIACSSFLKRTGDPNIPIQAIGLSLYEDLGRGDAEEVPGTKVTRTQWLDMSSLEMANLIGKNILIVDEVDDTRTTLEYAVRELQKDVEIAQKQLGREGEKTNFFVFVLHVCFRLGDFGWEWS